MQTQAELLQPDPAGAAQVEAALAVLHQADSRMEQADRFLTQVRISPAAWPIACALVRSAATSSAALMFAANTVYARLRSDWHAFADEAHRLTAYTLAVDGAVRPPQPVPAADPRAAAAATSAALAPVHCFGRAVGFALALARDPETRASMWDALMSRLRDEPTQCCTVLAAVIKEIEEASTADASLYSPIRAFCATRAYRVVPSALRVLQEPRLGDDHTLSTRAAVACLHAWRTYADRRTLAAALLRALPVAAVADDVGETLAEIVGYSGTQPELLYEICDGLIAIHGAQGGGGGDGDGGGGGVNTVQHAIAEVACALSDGNADELMEQHTPESMRVIQKATELLWLCIRCGDQRAFFAAVDGWANWIAAENLISKQQCVLGTDQVAALVAVVVDRISSPESIAQLIPSIVDAEVTDFDSELARVKDLLLAIASSVGVERYVAEITPILKRQCADASGQICASLLALSVACEEAPLSTAPSSLDNLSPSLTRALLLVMDLLKWTSTKERPLTTHADHRTAVRKVALMCLSAHTSTIATWPDDVHFVHAVRCAGAALMDEDTCEHAGHLVYELAERCTSRLVPFLPDLITSCGKTVEHMPLRAADVCTRALTRVASALPSHKQRLDALRSILTVPCERVERAWREGRVAEDEERVCRHLGVISTAMHEMNDNGARSIVFSRLHEAVVETAVAHSANGSVARAVCRLLETCVLPTLMDEEEEGEYADEQTTNGQQRHANQMSYAQEEQGRVTLAMSCALLAAECFERSSPPGEICWLQAVADICPHIVSGLDSAIGDDVKVKAIECLGRLLRTGLSVVDVCCDGELDRQPDMGVLLVKHAGHLLVHPLGSRCMLDGEVSALLGRAVLRGLRCANSAVVRESVAFWKRAFARGTEGDVRRRLLEGAGGPNKVTGGILCAAHVGRLAPLATDTVFAMCTWVAGAEGDAAEVLRQCLREAFSVEDVPRQGLDNRVKEMLFRGCVSSARSKREFRQAFDEVGRVCAMAMR